MASPGPFLALLAAVTTAVGADVPAPRREPVHPRRNVEEFSPVEAKWLRFTIDATVRGQPCLDELEAYGPDAPERNVALAEHGTQARASGTLPEYRIHALRHVNDGLYGNGHSWISDTEGRGWVELEFPAAVRLDRVVWSRDREGKFTDRLPVSYRVEASADRTNWQLVASSADRMPLEAVPAGNPVYENSVARIAPAPTDLPGAVRPAAREYLMRTWQTADGLPASTVTSILQAHDGWLWIGTTNGLARFDGVTFRTYGERDGLPNPSVTCLVEDGADTLWVGTEGGGLARKQGDGFLAVKTGKDRAGNTVIDLVEDAAGTVWVGTRTGVLSFRGGVPTRVSAVATRLAADASGVWMLVENVLARWNGRAFSPVPEELDRSRFSSLGALATGADGALWFGGANGYIGRFADDQVTTVGEGHPVLASTVWELLPATNGDLWVGTSASGLGRWRGGGMLHVTTDDGLPTNSVRALCEDSEGNVWVGTSGGGLTRLSTRRVEALTTRDGLSHNVTLALCQDAAGAVWIGTNGGGLNRWADGRVAPHAPNFVLENKSIPAVATDADGSLWIGTSGSGLLHVRGRAIESVSVPGRAVAALERDAEGALWVGTLDGGPARVDGGESTVPSGLEALAGQPVTSLLAAEDGAVWFGTAGHGVARWSGGVLRRWTRSDGLASDFVRTIRADGAGAVWIGTNGGLSRWKDGALASFTAAHGLPDVFISQIVDDGAGHLWLGTNRGIARISFSDFDAVASGRASRLEALSLGLGDGLPSLECTGGHHPAGLRLADGRLCFGTVAGLAVIDPERFAAAVEPPPAVIEDVRCGTASLVRAGPHPSPVQMKTGSEPVEFRFTALHFTAPERVRFRYRLRGVEETGWTEAGGARSATWARLPPGYTAFEVITSADGVTWSDPPASFALLVPTPWWRRPVVLGAGSVLAFGGMAAGVRFVTRRRLQRRMRALEQQFALERERTRIARDIHDDLGANLTQISLLSAMGREKRDQPAVVDEQFSAIATTAGELVQSLDAIVWAVNPRHDTLESLARYITRFAGDFCAHSAVRLRLDVPPELPEATLSSEVRHNLFLAAKEALNNALRHAGATELRIRMSADATSFTLSVEDDGRGFVPSAGGDGDGLDNMRRRLADCGGSCELSSAPGRGTSVVFHMPLSPP